MGLMLMWWILVSLFSISLTGNHPLWALAAAALGGAGIGVYLTRTSREQKSSPQVRDKPEGSSLLSPLASRPLLHLQRQNLRRSLPLTPYRLPLLLSPLASRLLTAFRSRLSTLDCFSLSTLASRLLTTLRSRLSTLLLQAFPVLILLFSKRLPLTLSLLSLILLLLLVICRKRTTGHFLVPTSLTLPILLLCAASATSLYASVDLPLSLADVFKLVAGVAIFYGIVNSLDSGRKIEIAVSLFVIAGACAGLGALLMMQASQHKLPLVSSLFPYLPSPLPRRIHPNYVGGTLVFFLPAAFWCVLFRRRGHAFLHATAFVLTGIGLLFTQSRGALIGAVAGVCLAGALAYRWVRWAVLPLAVGGVLWVYFFGIGTVIDPPAMTGLSHTWEGRKELWDRAIYIIQDFPFTGIGLHTFPVVTDLLYPLFLAGPNARAPHAHNFYLQVAVDTGIPGFVAFWMMLGAWGGMVWESLKRTAAGSEAAAFRPLVLGLAGGMLAHLVYSLTDTIALGEKAGIVFWAVLGLTAAVWRHVREAVES